MSDKRIPIGNTDEFVPIDELLLPEADCENCRYRVDPYGEGHCYMFKEKPGPTCAQFAAATGGE